MNFSISACSRNLLYITKQFACNELFFHPLNALISRLRISIVFSSYPPFCCISRVKPCGMVYTCIEKKYWTRILHFNVEWTIKTQQLFTICRKSFIISYRISNDCSQRVIIRVIVIVNYWIVIFFVTVSKFHCLKHVYMVT